MQNGYTKLDIIVNIAVCTCFNRISILPSYKKALLDGVQCQMSTLQNPKCQMSKFQKCKSQNVNVNVNIKKNPNVIVRISMSISNVKIVKWPISNYKCLISNIISNAKFCLSGHL